MKLLLLCITMICGNVMAQTSNDIFRAYLYNQEYKVYMRINFYEQDVTIPSQEVLGTVAGYLGKEYNSFCWPVVAATIKGKKAHLVMINDFGSEDLEATLTCKDDSTYVLKQGKGSTLKVPDNGKWQKLPGTLILKKRK